MEPEPRSSLSRRSTSTPRPSSSRFFSSSPQPFFKPITVEAAPGWREHSRPSASAAALARPQPAWPNPEPSPQISLPDPPRPALQRTSLDDPGPVPDDKRQKDQVRPGSAPPPP